MHTAAVGRALRCEVKTSLRPCVRLTEALSPHGPFQATALRPGRQSRTQPSVLRMSGGSCTGVFVYIQVLFLGAGKSAQWGKPDPQSESPQRTLPA
jgi:hypothetical protein